MNIDELILALSISKCPTEDCPPLPKRDRLPKMVTELSLTKSIYMKGSPMETKDMATTILIILLMNDCDAQYLVSAVDNEKLRSAEKYKKKILEFKQQQGSESYDWPTFVKIYSDKVKEFQAGYFALWAAQEMRECRFKHGYNPAQLFVSDVEKHRQLERSKKPR